MTPSEALTGLASIVGGGGVVSAFIAWMAYKTEAMKGRRYEPGSTAVASVTNAIGDVYGQQRFMEALTNALSLNTAALNKMIVLMEKKQDKEKRAEELRVLMAELRETQDRKHP